MSASTGTSRGWSFHADRGGTFTDLLGIGPDGSEYAHKLLSHAPQQYDDAVLTGIGRIVGCDAKDLHGVRIDELRLGTTVTTNALLEGRTSRCALLTNRGFEDLLVIGDQSRPDLFSLRIPPRQQLASRVVGIDARRDAQGCVISALDECAVSETLRALRHDGHESLAVALLHAPSCPDDENTVLRLARQLGFRWSCASHESSSEPGLLARAQTAVAEAALAPLLQRYIDRLRAALPQTRIRFMQSDGTLADAAVLRARNSIFSGPAGGVIGATHSARAAGIDRIVGLDMGGTSTDVFCTDGTPPVRDATTIARLTVRAPSLDLHTVAAGGGSRLIYQDGRLRVGPESAGADPGPACYGRDGPATITDVNVVLGRVHLPSFAARFGADGKQPIDAEASARALRAVVAHMPTSDGESDPLLRLAQGALQIATTTMANAVRRISTARGIDIRAHTLVAFGGAGAQHACAVAAALGMQRVLVPARASLLSAAGMGMAQIGTDHTAPIDAELDEDSLQMARALLDQLRADAEHKLQQQGTTLHSLQVLLRLHYAQADTVLELELADVNEIRQRFAARHQQQFGFSDPARRLILASVHLRAAGPGGDASPLAPATDDDIIGEQAMWLGEDVGWQQVPIYRQVGDAPIIGPALLLLDQSSFVVEAGWSVENTAQGLLAQRSCCIDAGPVVSDQQRDPIQLELYNHRFMAVAEEMGEALQRSAQSVNVRNRLDYSCAVFDRDGALIANAPHIPVHLGSMGDAVRAIISDHAAALRAGDGWLINDPYRGGTHLPDLTVIMPVFLQDTARPDAFVAARAHHPDIGGITPGSMPAESRDLADEGICISGCRIARDGTLDEGIVRRLLADGPYPARNPGANIADLRAQLAACARGAGLLADLSAQHGAAAIGAYMGHLLDSSEEAVRARIAGLAPARHEITMDSNAHICVALQTHQGRLLVDFRGSSGQDAGNENAPPSVVRAAVMYALRCWIDAPVALNEGFLRAVDIHVEHPSLLSPQAPAAVVAGNVETSQSVTDAVLVALGCVAESQGTMNNLSFGNADVQYYETLCGGAGAGPGFDGASAVHTHMTNSRITDAEIIERHYPVRLLRFALRADSGGAGRYSGGNGVERVLQYLQPVQLSLLTNRRNHAPRGSAGGGDALPGVNRLLRVDGREQALPSRCTVDVAEGDVLQILTPGGGAFGGGVD